VAQLVEALRYKPEGRGFNSLWCQLKFLLTQSFRPHYNTGVVSASNRNDYQEYLLGGKGGWGVGLNLPTLCADCLEIWKSHLPETLRDCSGLYRDYITFTFLLRRESYSGGRAVKCKHLTGRQI
jgi:hypothetical protein